MFVFNILKVFFYMRVSFHTVIVLLLSCGVYSGSIWEWKFLNYRETVQRLFRIEERNIKASSQNICRYCLQLIQNLLMMQFRCLRVSGALHVVCVEQTIRVMWEWLETFFTRFNDTHLRVFLKIHLVNFSQSITNPRNIKESHVCCNLLKIVLLQKD